MISKEVQAALEQSDATMNALMGRIQELDHEPKYETRFTKLEVRDATRRRRSLCPHVSDLFGTFSHTDAVKEGEAARRRHVRVGKERQEFRTHTQPGTDPSHLTERSFLYTVRSKRGLTSTAGIN